MSHELGFPFSPRRLKVNLTRRHLFALAAISLLIAGIGCSGRDTTGLEEARATVDPVVFDDDFSEDVYPQPFFLTNYVAVQLDSVYAYDGFAPDGARSLKINVAPQNSALGIYSGGVFTSSGLRDLTDFNALTFYARANVPVSLDIVGFGNDNTGNSLYEAGRGGIPLTSDWTFVIVPIPAPSKLIGERGLFTYAEGREEQYPEGYNIWIDEIKYANLSNIENPRPVMPSGNRQFFVGSTASLAGTRTIFTIDGAFVSVDHSPNYFDFITSDPSVAIVENSEIMVIGPGSATITAQLEGIDANGRIVLTSDSPPAEPAPNPTVPGSDVISMFSGVYTNVPVDTWDTQWGGSTAQVQDYAVQGNDTKMYSTLNFVGIEFRNPMINASAMTHFHMDVYAPSGTNFKIKLVSFPSDLPGSIETQDLILDATTTPAFIAGGWSSLEIPLTDFALPAGWDWSNIGQMVLSTTNASLVLVDNIYWHK